MPSKHKSPAKVSRSIRRAMEYKKEVLTDLYDIDVIANYETQEILWNVTSSIVLTLKPNCEILETRFIFNPSFSTYPLGQRLSSFQNMWKPDQNSFILFSCIVNHLKQNSLSCDKLCAHFGIAPICGGLLQTLATSGGRPPD